MLEVLAGYLDQFSALAGTWGYVLIFVFMAVESSFIPFPSEVVMLPAGFLAARGELTFANGPIDATLAVAAGILGSLAGAFFNYYLSARVGLPFLRRYGKWFFVKGPALDRACALFNRYGAATTFTCRLIPVVRQLISIPAGIARMPLKSFTFFTALGSGIWSAILCAIGYALGSGAKDMTYLELVRQGKALASANLPWVVAGAVALVAAYYFAARLAMGRKTK